MLGLLSPLHTEDSITRVSESLWLFQSLHPCFQKELASLVVRYRADICNVMNRTYGGCRLRDSDHNKTAHTPTFKELKP